jgi:hypothetical protein
MPARSKSVPNVRQSQVDAFRLEKHHLSKIVRVSPVDICANISGVQAQIMSAADLALWARNHSLTRAEIRGELANGGALVRTSLMRQTLHIIPNTEFSVYITALKASRMSPILRGMSQFRVQPHEVDSLNANIVEALRHGPLPIPAIRKLVEPRASKNMKVWMTKIWNPMRPAVVEGLICYGPDQGNRITFVRSEQWLPKQRAIDVLEAQQILLFKFMSAYGPATPRDFGKWSGISMKEVKPVWDSWMDHLVEISVEGKRAWSLRKQLAALLDSGFSKSNLRLLGAFDPFLLAHHEKDHLVPRHHYKSVYRNQGWISAVVLINGRVAGVWSHSKNVESISVNVNLHEKLSKDSRAQLEEEVESLGKFLGAPAELKITR